MNSAERKARVNERLRKRNDAATPELSSRPAKENEIIIADSGRGLFSPNNPLVKKANEVFTPDQIDEYKKQGEYMYNFDYDKVNIDGTGNDENTQFILIALRSGLKISSLDEDEIAFMNNTYGLDWATHFGIVDE
jgi:hypothetical protein